MHTGVVVAVQNGIWAHIWRRKRAEIWHGGQLYVCEDVCLAWKHAHTSHSFCKFVPVLLWWKERYPRKDYAYSFWKCNGQWGNTNTLPANGVIYSLTQSFSQWQTFAFIGCLPGVQPKTDIFFLPLSQLWHHLFQCTILIMIQRHHIGVMPQLQSQTRKCTQ